MASWSLVGWWSMAVLGSVGSALAAPDVCTCTAGDDFRWLAVDDPGRWACAGGDGQASADDDFVIEAGCRVVVKGDIVQAAGAGQGGIEVRPGGQLTARVGGGDRRRLSLGRKGLLCRGTCDFRGAFRTLAASPSNAATPQPWEVGDVLPCDGDCSAQSELACVTPVVEPGVDVDASLQRLRTAVDLGKGTQDWLCFWDFDRLDHRSPYDESACYPVAALHLSDDPGGARICVDVRQGNDSEYPHRLRRLGRTTLAGSLQPGWGCASVLAPDLGLRAPRCGGEVVRLDGATSPIEADDELVGRFLRFENPGGEPDAVSYMILQVIDCSAAPPSPHACNGSSDDLVVIGSSRGVERAIAAGTGVWIDYGWRPGDRFFVMAPVQFDSSTPHNSDSNIDLAGSVFLRGVHFTDLGGGVSDLNDRGNRVVVVGGFEGSQTTLTWDHVLIRNDTGDFNPNTGVNLTLDSLSDARIGHTALMANTGHAVVFLASEARAAGLVLEDFNIRHHQDGCFNHVDKRVTPVISIRRSWCAFIQSDAQSAQWMAWLAADPSGTVVEDAACVACDGGVQYSSMTTSSSGRWTLRGVLLWAPLGGMGPAVVDDSAFLGFRGSATASGSVLRARTLRNVVVRGVSVLTDRHLVGGDQIVVRDSLFSDLRFVGEEAPVSLGSGSKAINNAWINVEAAVAGEQGGSGGEDVIGEEDDDDSDGVTWRRNLFAWTPGWGTSAYGAFRFRAESGVPAPTYDGHAIAYHDWIPGLGEALVGLDDENEEIPLWGAGPCFQDNDRDAADPSLLPPTTVTGVPLGFVDPFAYRFDVADGSLADQIGCGVDPRKPVGARRYRWFHARTGLVPEIMAADVDGDGSPEDVDLPPCAGAQGACLDNCPTVFNPGQRDADGDGLGDACDAG